MHAWWRMNDAVTRTWVRHMQVQKQNDAQTRLSFHQDKQRQQILIPPKISTPNPIYYKKPISCPSPVFLPLLLHPLSPHFYTYILHTHTLVMFTFEGPQQQHRNDIAPPVHSLAPALPLSLPLSLLLLHMRAPPCFCIPPLASGIDTESPSLRSLGHVSWGCMREQQGKDKRQDLGTLYYSSNKHHSTHVFM